MASSHVNQNATRFQDSATFEHRPIMLLKDFLRDDSLYSRSSSSNGFHMYPRKSKVLQPLPPKSNKPSMVLLRTRSRKAAATTISAVHKLINVVKFLPFASIKSSLALSRKSKTTRSNVRNNINVSSEKVKVKDILRWKSFRDMVEERSASTDTATTTTTTTTSCSRRSSWCDSDFTSSEDYLPPWCGENDEFLGKKSLVGEHGTNVTLLRNPKGGYSFEESEQQSPVSVLESSFGDNEGYFSPFHRSFSNHTKSKRCMVAQRVEEFEVFSSRESIILEEEEKVDAIARKASMLLSRVEELTSVDFSKNKVNDYHLIMDLIVHALSANEDLNDGELDNEILSTIKFWMSGECDKSYEWELEDIRDVFIKDMEKGVQWKKFRQEEDEISKELEIKVLNELIDEVLNDLIS